MSIYTLLDGDRTNPDTTNSDPPSSSSREPTVSQAPLTCSLIFDTTTHQTLTQAPFKLQTITSFSPLQLYHNTPTEIHAAWLHEPGFIPSPPHPERVSALKFQHQQIVTAEGHLDPRILALVAEAQNKLTRMKGRKKSLARQRVLKLSF